MRYIMLAMAAAAGCHWGAHLSSLGLTCSAAAAAAYTGAGGYGEPKWQVNKGARLAYAENKAKTTTGTLCQN